MFGLEPVEIRTLADMHNSVLAVESHFINDRGSPDSKMVVPAKYNCLPVLYEELRKRKLIPKCQFAESELQKMKAKGENSK